MHQPVISLLLLILAKASNLVKEVSFRILKRVSFVNLKDES